MRPVAPPIFLRFLRRVHRRLVAVRLVEWSGAGLLGGCAVAAVLIPIALWQGRPAWGVAGWAVGAGAAIGLAFGLGRRPSLLDAAVEADRQLRLADLLGTACSLHQGRADDPAAAPWAGSVVAMADARCRGASPSSVALRRFGARAWGGIGLATALVVALAALSTSPADTRAGGSSAGRTDLAGDRRADARTPGDRPVVASWGPSQHRRTGPTEGTDEHARRRDDGATVPIPEPGNPDDPARDEARSSRPPTPGGGGRGAGTAQQRTDARSPTPPRPPAGAAPPGSGTPPHTPAAQSRPAAAEGSGRSATQIRNRAPADDATAGDVTRPVSPSEVPPWQSDTWPADVARAREAIDAGRVPDAYRELLRRYFDRP